MRYPASVEAAARDADVVVNLVGILFERGRQRFDTVQALRRRAGRARRRASRRAHDPCLGDRRRRELVIGLCAQPRPIGEKAVLAAMPEATIVSTVDHVRTGGRLLQPFAALARILPALPLIGGGETRFQPVFVGDVAEAIARAVDGNGQGRHDLRGRRAGGTDLQGADGIRARSDRAPTRLLMPLPFALAKFQATVPAISADAAAHARPGRVAQDRQRGVAPRPSTKAAHSQGLASTPTAMEAIVPTYLWRFRKTGQFKVRGRFA